ncbi:hypothetical protein [Phenylobacterium sp. 58.2.17]|uniref:hypothetical protein n=1 Tax=Phenylobacterium sp. 58.2.17 TaxID=2969306 RepID=UPI0022649432|nr:hypothetical protein [Phenylobacterium sp. 58.2.17]MCX7586529.1 hypothetical protein [Phenylobacterium sp. 58.2.17]
MAKQTARNAIGESYEFELPQEPGRKDAAASLSSAFSVEDRQLMLDVKDQLVATHTLLSTPAGALPAESRQATADLDRHVFSVAAAGSVDLVAAVVAQIHRVYRLKFTVGAACVVELRSGATVLERWRFPAAGGVIVLSFSSFPWYETAAGEALVLGTSTAAQVDGSVETLTGP